MQQSGVATRYFSCHYDFQYFVITRHSIIINITLPTYVIKTSFPGYNMISCHVMTINISEWATTWYWSVQCWYTGLQKFKGLQRLSCPPTTTSWCSSVIISTKHTCLLPPLPDYMLYLMKPYVYMFQCMQKSEQPKIFSVDISTTISPPPSPRPETKFYLRWSFFLPVYFYRYLLIKTNPAKSYNKRLNVRLF